MKKISETVENSEARSNVIQNKMASVVIIQKFGQRNEVYQPQKEIRDSFGTKFH